MKTAKKIKLHLADMPTDYAALCRVFIPRPIHDKIAYRNTAEIAEVFAGFEGKMSPDQEDYFDLLCSTMERWNEQHIKRQKRTGLDMLKHLLENHELSGADLSRLLGVSPMLGPMILRGERQITAAHARKLGEKFGLPPGVFIEE